MIVNNPSENKHLTNILYTEHIEHLKNNKDYIAPNILVVSSYTQNSYFNYQYLNNTSYELYFIDNDKNINQLTYNINEVNGLSIKNNKLDLNIDNNTLVTNDLYKHIYVNIDNISTPTSINKGVFKISSNLYYNDNYLDNISTNANNNGVLKVALDNSINISNGLKQQLNNISYYINTCESLITTIDNLSNKIFNDMYNIINIKPGDILYIDNNNNLSLTKTDDNEPYLVCIIASNILPDRYPRFIPIKRSTISYMIYSTQTSYIKSSFSEIPIYNTNNLANIKNGFTNIIGSSYGYIATDRKDWKNNLANPFNTSKHYYVGNTTDTTEKTYATYLSNDLIDTDLNLVDDSLFTEILPDDFIEKYSNTSLSSYVFCNYSILDIYQNSVETSTIIKYLANLEINDNRLSLKNATKVITNNNSFNRTNILGMRNYGAQAIAQNELTTIDTIKVMEYDSIDDGRSGGRSSVGGGSGTVVNTSSTTNTSSTKNNTENTQSNNYQKQELPSYFDLNIYFDKNICYNNCKIQINVYSGKTQLTTYTNNYTYDEFDTRIFNINNVYLDDLREKKYIKVKFYIYNDLLYYQTEKIFGAHIIKDNNITNIIKFHVNKNIYGFNFIDSLPKINSAKLVLLNNLLDENNIKLQNDITILNKHELINYLTYKLDVSKINLDFDGIENKIKCTCNESAFIVTVPDQYKNIFISQQSIYLNVLFKICYDIDYYTFNNKSIEFQYDEQNNLLTNKLVDIITNINNEEELQHFEYNFLSYKLQFTIITITSNNDNLYFYPYGIIKNNK